MELERVVYAIAIDEEMNIAYANNKNKIAVIDIKSGKKLCEMDIRHNNNVITM